MKNCFLLLVVLSIFLSCSSEPSQHAKAREIWMARNNRLKVLSTIAMIDDLVRQIGGEYIDSLTLINGELDPHSYQLVKGDDEKLSFADLIFSNGLGLEHGPSLQRYLKENPKSIALGNQLMRDNPELIIHYKGQLDPHIWMDISLWAKTVPYIVENLSHKDPLHADIYRKNGEYVFKSLLDAHHKIKEQLGQIASSKRYLVTSHDAFNYFARAYLAIPGEDEQAWRNRVAAPEGLAPESQISTTDIQAIIDHLKCFEVHVLFPESNVNRDSIRKIVNAAKEKGLDVKIADVSLYADAMGKPESEGDTYIKMISYNAKIIAQYLKQNVN